MINGVINIYKEKGYTSHDVVAKLRGILKQKKIGHTGTLDPDAEGVLPVCLGKATKICDLLTDKDKCYESILLLGISTDTQDTSGIILEEKHVNSTVEQVKEAVMSFVGAYHQIPPMYSALKVNGKKLYELAREGKVIEREARKVQIHQIQIEEIDLPRVKMTVTCSKGTYIRTLCHDIGEKLSCGGCMEQLTRTKVSRFVLADAIKLDEVEALQTEGVLMDHIVPVDCMFSYPSYYVKADYHKWLYNGNSLLPSYFKEEQTKWDLKIKVYDENQVFIGIYEYNPEKDAYKPIKILKE